MIPLTMGPSPPTIVNMDPRERAAVGGRARWEPRAQAGSGLSWPRLPPSTAHVWMTAPAPTACAASSAFAAGMTRYVPSPSPHVLVHSSEDLASHTDSLGPCPSPPTLWGSGRGQGKTWNSWDAARTKLGLAQTRANQGGWLWVSYCLISEHMWCPPA